MTEDGRHIGDSTPSPNQTPRSTHPAPSTRTDPKFGHLMFRYDPMAGRPPLWSSSAHWQDLTQLHQLPAPMPPGAPWTGRWTVTFRHGLQEHTRSIADLRVDDLLVADPMRHATWHPRMRARAGVRYAVSTNEWHAHSSLVERDAIICLDFDRVSELASEPFQLRWYDHHGNERVHIPDFIAAIGPTITVINTKPAHLINDKLLEDCAALGNVAISRGWHTALITGYTRPAIATITALSSHIRIQDRLGYTRPLLEHLRTHGPTSRSDLCRIFDGPAVALALVQKLLWERVLSTDLNAPFGGESLIYLAGREPQ